MKNHGIIHGRMEPVIAFLLIALPCVTFLALAMHFCINLPFYDDFSVILKPIRRALSTGKPWAFRQYMLARSQGHLPLITHAIVWLQIKYYGSVNFKWSTIVGDVGAIISVVVMVLYFNKKYNFSFVELIPIPFFLLSIVHWESMDFMVPAWQFYWGSCLLPILCFIAVIERRWILGSAFFGCALFFSSGALSLYPLIMIYYALKKQWKCTLGFGLLSGFCLIYFFAHLTPEMVPRKIPDPVFLIYYLTEFMGNIVSNGQYELQSIAWPHRMIGVLVIGMGVYGFALVKGYDFLKLLFLYVLLLAFMAIYTRGYIPPRYSLFALIGVITAGYLFVVGLSSKFVKLSQKRCFIWMSIFSICLWVHSLYMCFGLLESNKKLRNEAMLRYQQTGDNAVLTALIWDVEFGEILLRDAKDLGVYDYTQYKNAYIEPGVQQ